MNSRNAIELFIMQLKRNVILKESKLKVVLLPSSVKEDGLIITIAPRKTFLDTRTKGVRATRAVRLRLAVEGAEESHTGLFQALEAIEKLDAWLSFSQNLEGIDGAGIPNTRITSTASEEDSFLSSPNSIEAQDVLDERIITITIPQEDL